MGNAKKEDLGIKKVLSLKEHLKTATCTAKELLQ